MPWTGKATGHQTRFQLGPECPVIAAPSHSRPRVRWLGKRPDPHALRRPRHCGAPASMGVAVRDGGVAPPRDGGAGAYRSRKGSRMERAPRVWGAGGGGGARGGLRDASCVTGGWWSAVPPPRRALAAAAAPHRTASSPTPHAALPGRQRQVWPCDVLCLLVPAGAGGGAHRLGRHVRRRGAPWRHGGARTHAGMRCAAHHTTPVAFLPPSTGAVASVVGVAATRRPVATRGRVATVPLGGGGGEARPAAPPLAAILCLTLFLIVRMHALCSCTWSPYHHCLKRCFSQNLYCVYVCPLNPCRVDKWRADQGGLPHSAGETPWSALPHGEVSKYVEEPHGRTKAGILGSCSWEALSRGFEHRRHGDKVGSLPSQIHRGVAADCHVCPVGGRTGPTTHLELGLRNAPQTLS